MTPLERVARAARQVEAARLDLRHQAAAAVAAGIPSTKVAAAAGVERATIARWIKEHQQP